MNVNWLISLYDDSCEKIAHTCELLGYNVKCVGKIDYFLERPWWTHFPTNSCTVFMGNLGFARDVNKGYGEYHNWVPGAICDLNFFKYKNYSQYIGEDLLNWPYSITTYGCYKQNREHWFDLYGNNDCIFVRPDSGFKTFNGHVAYKEECELDKYGLVDDNELIIVSEPKNINAEDRVVIVEDKFVSGSSYRVNGKLESYNIDGFISHKRRRFIERVIKSIPHGVYIMDIAHTDKGYKVIELNSFSCSGMYECDMTKVIPAVSDWAYKQYLKG